MKFGALLLPYTHSFVLLKTQFVQRTHKYAPSRILTAPCLSCVLLYFPKSFRGEIQRCRSARLGRLAYISAFVIASRQAWQSNYKYCLIF